MTLAMPDSVRVADLPPGYPAYLGYYDGKWPTAHQLLDRFPAAHVIGLTVTGETANADGADIEPGNLTARNGALWARQRINRQPGFRPVMYASVHGEPGYGMGEVLTALAAVKVSRTEVRLLAAHWGQGPHICGPGSCGAISEDMDGTQWTDKFWVSRGIYVDMSELQDGFFGSETEVWVRELGIVRQGDTGEAVRTVQGLCNARHQDGQKPDPLVIDGIFGWKTQGTVEVLQANARITQDGVVGPQTWPVLLGIA